MTGGAYGLPGRDPSGVSGPRCGRFSVSAVRVSRSEGGIVMVVVVVVGGGFYM